VDLLEQAARVLAVLLLGLVDDAVVERGDGSRPGEVPGHREMRLESAVLARDGSHKRKGDDEEHGAHGVDCGSKASCGGDVVRAGHR